MDAQRLPRLSLDLLRGFRAAARHLSFTRAAQELFVTQPAVSREIRTLEEQLGTPLFTRVNRGLRLTRAGEDLYRAVDEALAMIEAATQRVVGGGRGLAVTTTVPLASTWLVPRLPQFAQLHPEVDLRVVASNDTLDLARERLDVAIRHVRRGNAARAGERLCDYRIFPVCAPHLAQDRSRPLRTAGDLSRHTLLDFETVRDARPWSDWMLWFDAKAVAPVKGAGSLRFSHYDQVVHAAVEGSGVAVGRWPHLARQLQDGVLIAPFGIDGVIEFGAFHVVAAETVRRPEVEAFVAWLHAEAARDAVAVQAVASGRRRRARVAPLTAG